jgi:hypothetical protein
MNDIRTILDKKRELIDEALYFLGVIEREEYESESELEILQGDLEAVLTELGIETEYEE